MEAETSALGILDSRFGSNTCIEVETTSLEAGPITEVRAYLMLYDFGKGPPTEAQLACARELKCVTDNVFFGETVRFAVRTQTSAAAEALNTA